VKPLLDTVVVEPRGQVICGLFVRSTGPWVWEESRERGSRLSDQVGDLPLAAGRGVGSASCGFGVACRTFQRIGEKVL
jgi:hypothetical protein